MSVEMKDSGIAWIGEIPKHWDVTRLKNLASDEHSLIIDGDWIESNVIESEGIRYFTTGNIGDGYFKEQGLGYISRETFKKLNCTMVYGGDLVFSRLNNPIGRSCIIPQKYHECIVAVDNVIFRPNKNVSKTYLMYVSMCTGFQNENALIARGATMQRMSRSQLVKVYVPFPSCEEQSRIANYLDKKCAEIDELIALQEQMIDQLTTYKQAVITETVTKGLDPKVKMKDSGVEWIGEIPEHWDVKRIKNVCSCFGRIGFRGYTNDDMVQEGEGAITLSPSNMKNMTMDYSKCSYLSWNKYYESPEIQIQVGDVLLVKTGSTFGKSSYVHEIPMECTINPQIICFKDHKESAKFLNYLLNTPMAKGQVDTTVVGGTIPTIAQSKIINYSFAFPPLSEQQSIANYLDQKCKEIDELISVKKDKIEKLKAYKKSVIFEYVTGKKHAKI